MPIKDKNISRSFQMKTVTSSDKSLGSFTSDVSPKSFYDDCMQQCLKANSRMRHWYCSNKCNNPN